MSRLPTITGQECIRALERAGFHATRRESSHVVLRRVDPFAQLVVPDHRQLDRGTLRAIIRSAGLSVDEFNALLKQG